jgi:hypothetical protein
MKTTDIEVPPVVIPLNEQAEIGSLPGKEKGRYALGGFILKGELHLLLGDFTRVAVSLDTFEHGANCAPVFQRFKIVDYGQTLQFGPYETAVDAVLATADEA